MTTSLITIDTSGLYADDKDNLLVDTISKYPFAYKQLHNAIHSGRPISLLVRDSTVAEWLTTLARAYGDTYVRVLTYTPQEALAARWGVPVPADVSGADLQRSGLLNLQITAKQGQSFWDALLEHFYGDAFTYQAFPIGSISSLLNRYPPNDPIDNTLLARAVRDKLSHWESAAANDSVRWLVQRLVSDPNSLRRDLGRYKLLRNYPDDMGLKSLDQQLHQFRKAQVNTDALALTDAALSATLPEIADYLDDITDKITSPQDIMQLIGEMSGYLPQEFTWIDGILAAHPEWITHDLLRQLDRRFRSLSDSISSPMATLRGLVQPEFPTAPDNDWGLQQWLAWIRTSYMPYYAWLDRQGTRDEAVAGYAGAFADWYYDHFIELKNGEPEQFAFSALLSERERIRATNAVTLVLIIDNFNYVHLDDLSRLFSTHGFSLHDEQPVLSLVPTATEVCKAGIIAGRGDQVDIVNVNYPSIVSNEWNSELDGGTAGYLANIGELQKLPQLSHKLYFLNFLLIDELLHQDNRSTGRPHADLVLDALKTLTSTVADFAKRFQLDNCLLVYAISDHGSTRIPQGIVNVLDPS